MLLLSSCGKQLNKRVTLWRNDKIPYGTYYAYHNLQYLFDDALIQTSDKSPVKFYQTGEGASAYIIIGLTVRPDEKELNAIMNHAMEGNHVFISALNIGQNILDSFRLAAAGREGFMFRTDSLTVSLENPADYDSLPFTYPGFRLARYFSQMDSSVTNILGRDAAGNANFVRFNYQGGGAVYLHLAPVAFSNFFLLHKLNKQYYDLALSAIPDTVNHVRWDDYYRHHINGKSNADKSAFSKLDTFLKNDVLRWAFWLTVLLFGIVYLFESKRKQRVIPTIKKLNNTSLDFVKTIGRLYFQRKDNKNLAKKIATHFLGHVRSRYNLPTSQLDETFRQKLAYKSGYPAALVDEIVGHIESLDEAEMISDEELLSFNDKIDNFINKP